MNLDLVEDYFAFVVARHEVWEARQAGLPQPWTSDPIVSRKKFTNVFRVLDYGSQFVVREFAQPSTSAWDRDRLFRLFLYRHTGRPEPWEWFEAFQGKHPDVEDIELLRSEWKKYRSGSANPIFTGAYLVFPQSQDPGTDKLDSILDLSWRLFSRESPSDIMNSWRLARDQQERFNILRSQNGVGDFMAMQILTDWGYVVGVGHENRENEFVVCGPGAVRGAKHLSPDWTPDKTVRWAHRELSQLGVSLTTPRGRSRTPSLMDAQNTLCEFSKYVRFMGKPLTGGDYRPAHPGPQTAPLLPSFW